MLCRHGDFRLIKYNITNDEHISGANKNKTWIVKGDAIQAFRFWISLGMCFEVYIFFYSVLSNLGVVRLHQKPHNKVYFTRTEVERVITSCWLGYVLLSCWYYNGMKNWKITNEAPRLFSWNLHLKNII